MCTVTPVSRRTIEDLYFDMAGVRFIDRPANHVRGTDLPRFATIGRCHRKGPYYRCGCGVCFTRRPHNTETEAAGAGVRGVPGAEGGSGSTTHGCLRSRHGTPDMSSLATPRRSHPPVLHHSLRENNPGTIHKHCHSYRASPRHSAASAPPHGRTPHPHPRRCPGTMRSRRSCRT